MTLARRTATALLFALVAAVPAPTLRAQAQVGPTGAQAQAGADPRAAARVAGPRVGLLAPERIRQGDPLLLWALSDLSLEGGEAALVSAEGRRMAAAMAFAGPALAASQAAGASPSAPEGPQGAGDAVAFRAFGFLMAIPVDLAPGNYRIVVQAPPVELAASLAVEARGFPSEDIGLDEANTKLRKEPDPRKEEEARKLTALLGRADPEAVYLDGSPFMIPLVPRRKSAGFGDKRRYLYTGGGSDASLHAGFDLAVASGTEVVACGPGKVVMTASRAVTGFTVVVEHLPGLYSLYMHLSSISVEEGQAVERGGVLGLSGSTGLSTGPHLHWEIRARGQAVDPEYWLSRPPLDKDRAAIIILTLIEGR